MSKYRTKQVNVRLTELEFSRLIKYREATGRQVSVSEAIRDLAHVCLPFALRRRRVFRCHHADVMDDIKSALISEFGKPTAEERE